MRVNKARNTSKSPTQSSSFNANLPIVINVLQKIGFNRYMLKIGNKEISTKSQKKLKEKTKYWGELRQYMGVINVGGLNEFPEAMNEFFIEDDSFWVLENLATNSSLKWLHSWILDNLANTNSKHKFKTLTSMLLALDESIIHLPLKFKNKLFLLQIKLAEQKVYFYFIFENLAPINGDIINDEITINAIYDKTIFWLEKHKPANLKVNINKVAKISPLWQINQNLLDVKG